MQYYAHHIGDFIKDTNNLNDHQSMTYLRMLWTYYADETPLQGSCEDLAFAMRSDEKTVRTLLKHFFFERDGVWIHLRCEQEIKNFYDRSSKARASALAGWKIRRELQTQSERIANASESNANATKSDASSILPITHYPLPITNTKTNTPPKQMPSPVGVCVDLWADYMTIRKSKKSPMTKTALSGLERECNKAGLSLEAGIRVCCERGWASLKAEWLDDKKLTVHQQQMQASARTIGFGRQQPPFYETVQDIPQLEDHDHDNF